MDWMFFATQLRTLISAGLPLNRALELLAADAPRERIRRLCVGLGEDLRRGLPFAAAIDRSAPNMPPVLRALLVTGNATGNLTQAVERFALMQEQMRMLQSVLLRASLYPICLCLLGMVVMVVAPAAEASVTGRDPWPVFWSALIIVVVPAIVAVVAAWLFGAFLRAERFRRAVGGVLLVIPGIGHLSRRVSAAIFLELLAGSIEAGQPLVVAWDLAARSVPNAAVGARLEPGSGLLRRGESLSRALESTKQFARGALSMTLIGELSGSAPALLRNIAARQRDEVMLTSRVVLSVTAPLSLIVVAVGFFMWPPALAILLFVLLALASALRP